MRFRFFIPWTALAAAFLLMVGIGTSTTHGQAAGAEGRKPEEIQKELGQTGSELSDLVASPEALLDEANQATLGKKALPLMRKMSNLYEELATAVPDLKSRIAPFQTSLRAMMAVLGDKQANDDIARLTVSNDANEAAEARACSILVRWVKARKDPGTQEKLASELSSLGKNNPQNSMLVEVCSLMSESAATAALAEQVEAVVRDDLKSETADALSKALAAKRKLKSIDGRPLVIEGTALDGSKFSTANWKGKVILVDFWATWCAPCMQEMPNVKKVYAEYHPKGLEIVGISCDKQAEKLRGFLDTNKEVAWPQLFDPAAQGWHPLADQYGITAIPTMFLIDKKGIVRTVKAQENYQELIPKLLAE